MAEQQGGEQLQPPQQQDRRPGLESEMTPRPVAEDPKHRGSGKLAGKVALITGGDSGIGRAVAIAFAREGADVGVAYLNEHSDAEETKRQVEQEGRRCLLLAGDIGQEAFCRQIVERTVSELGKLDILVNNAAEQHPQESIEDITEEQLERTFRTNIFAMFFLTKAALPHLKEGSAIVNTTSVTAYRGRFHALAVPGVGGKEDPGQRRGAGPDLDAADSLDLSTGEGGLVRAGHADEARRPARGGGLLLRVPRLGRRLVSFRAGSPSQRRRSHQRLTPPTTWFDARKTVSSPVFRPRSSLRQSGRPD
jgi:NAD(P)-dependent dehydrogenase (short-subunit alcohol dehydrogenase family)